MRRRFQNHNLKSEEKIKQALIFIDTYIKENGHSPSVREIAEAMEVPSTSTIAGMIQHVIEEGYLAEPKKFTPNGSRVARTLHLTTNGKKMIKVHS